MLLLSLLSFGLGLLFWLPAYSNAYGYDYDIYELNAPPPLCSAYEMLLANTSQCVRRCPITCVEGVCFEATDCACANQYVTSPDQSLLCVASNCLPGCIEAGGFCAAPNLCLCRKPKHYYYDARALRCRRRLPRSLDLCHGRCLFGSCAYTGECICAEGYRRLNIQWGRRRQQECAPICEHNCGPRAYCFAPNMCACKHKHQHYSWDGKCSKYY